MNMAGDATELDRLIEEGLTLYGQGDIDGALMVWEQVLSVDPDNAQANSYVDYVRMNYELLTSDLADEASGPFGIGSDEPEYQIEILPGEVPPPGPAPMYMDPLDQGWFIGDEGDLPSTRGEASADDGGSDAMMTLELEADEPEPGEAPSAGDDTFEDATREYGAHRRPTARAASEPRPSEFAPENTPTPGFDSLQDVQTTGLRPRDTGFVKPTRDVPSRANAFDDLELGEPGQPQPAPAATRPRRASTRPPELQMTLRTPDADREDTTDGASPFEQSFASLELDPRPTSRGASDLITSLPTPRRATTKDLPGRLVPPVAPVAHGFDDLELDAPAEPPPPASAAPTRELGTGHISFAPTQTGDFAEKPTKASPRPALDPLVSAPTRELGLRPPSSSPAGRTPTEDQPTLTARPVDPANEPTGTRADIVLPFDPIDARTAQILEDVDETAPATESKEDKTRRRIGALLEHASDAAQRGELDRAVAAVDLALSEDPNSALAQKLIHRNRDAIMGVFQGFLGSLDRQPMLARPLHELGTAPISPRAAFLLSRVDGSITLDEILDVSGMPRLEAYRHLCQLFLRGILR